MVARGNSAADRETGKRPHVLVTELEIKGFRSIAAEKIALQSVNVLIGPNGAGKSNLIAFFRMLSFMLSSPAGLATYVGKAGGASSLLHNGPKVTDKIEGRLVLATDVGINEYDFALAYAAGDTLYFERERCRFSAKGLPVNQRWIDFGAGHSRPKLLDAPQDAAKKTQRTILSLLRSLQVYQFHDTSTKAPVKQSGLVDDDRYLREDAANLAPFLLRLQTHHEPYYRRIVDTLRQFAPFFQDFVLEPDGRSVLLRWRAADSDVVFGPHQMSDGTIRAVALLTLLLQPPHLLPSMIVIDEPELGLHPFAARVIAGLVHSAAIERQCLVATQSPQFLDEFDVSEVVIVERVADGSRFRRLTEGEYQRWLSEYSLSELWDMNVLGGRPHAITA